MTQSLSNLMSSYWQSALLLLAIMLLGLLLILLIRAVYRYQLRKKRQVVRSENHPAIAQRFYKISEVKQSRLNLPGVQKPKFKQAVVEASGAYHIPAGLWDV